MFIYWRDSPFHLCIIASGVMSNVHTKLEFLYNIVCMATANFHESFVCFISDS